MAALLTGVGFYSGATLAQTTSDTVVIDAAPITSNQAVIARIQSGGTGTAYAGTSSSSFDLFASPYSFSLNSGTAALALTGNQVQVSYASANAPPPVTLNPSALTDLVFPSSSITAAQSVQITEPGNVFLLSHRP
jgi:hypothetical protein